MSDSPVSRRKYSLDSTTAASSRRAPTAISTGARFAQALPASRAASNAARDGASAATTTNRHGWRFEHEGDQRAASSIRSIFSVSTGRGENARRLRRAAMTRWNAIDAGCYPPVLGLEAFPARGLPAPFSAVFPRRRFRTFAAFFGFADFPAFIDFLATFDFALTVGCPFPALREARVHFRTPRAFAYAGGIDEGYPK